MTNDSADTSVASPAASKLPEEQRRQYERLVAEIDPYVESGTPGPAIGKLDEILNSIPEDDEHALLRSGLRAQRAALALDLGRSEAAFDEVEAAIDAGWRSAESYSTAGWASFALGRSGASREYFDQSIEIDADHVPALTGRAMALLEIDEYDLAISDLTHAINQDPKNPELYALRGEAHIGLRNLEKAERDTRKARELAPLDADYALSLARLKVVQGEIPEAREVIDDAIDEDDAELEPLLLRSHLAMLSGDSSAARSDAIRASNHYPDEAFAFVQLVHVQLAEGNLSLAQKAAERAVRLDPSLPDAYMVRGAVLQMQGQHDEAREDLERARQAPSELPMFLLGSFYDILEASGFNHSLMNLMDQYSSMYPNNGGEGDSFDPENFGDFDPSEVMDRLFDDSGKVNERLKPMLEMAMKNAPNILENLPPGIAQGLGGIDPSDLEDVDLEDVSSDQLEQQLEQIYEMMESGQNPFSMFEDAFGGSSDDDD